jgi:hypothetical protein
MFPTPVVAVYSPPNSPELLLLPLLLTEERMYLKLKPLASAAPLRLSAEVVHVQTIASSSDAQANIRHLHALAAFAGGACCI